MIIVKNPSSLPLQYFCDHSLEKSNIAAEAKAVSKLKCQKWDLNSRPLMRTRIQFSYLPLFDMFALKSGALDRSAILTWLFTNNYMKISSMTTNLSYTRHSTLPRPTTSGAGKCLPLSLHIYLYIRVCYTHK